MIVICVVGGGPLVQSSTLLGSNVVSGQYSVLSYQQSCGIPATNETDRNSKLNLYNTTLSINLWWTSCTKQYRQDREYRTEYTPRFSRAQYSVVSTQYLPGIIYSLELTNMF